MLAKEEVLKVEGGMRSFGMEQEDAFGKGSIKKTTAFMTNAAEIAKRLENICKGRHRHIPLVGGAGRTKRRCTLRKCARKYCLV